jgi:hypothetical protein
MLNTLNPKYDKLKTPIFEKRNKLINQEEKGFKDFWSTVLKNASPVKYYQQDEPSFDYIEDITYESKPKKLILLFHFRENPFFSNKCLKKEIHVHDVNGSCNHEDVEE